MCAIAQKSERKRHNMKNKRILTAIALFMAALTLAFALSSCTKKTTPTQYIFDAVKATADNTASDLGKLLAASKKSGEAEIIFKGNDATASFLDISGLNLKVNYGGNTSLTSASLTAGEKSASLNLWQKGNKLAVGSSLIGDTVYGIDLEKGKDSYLASVFGKADSDFSLIGIFGENGEIFDSLKNNADLSAAIEKLTSKYKDLIIKTIEDNAKTGLEKGTATIELNSESIKKIAKALYDTAKNDKELRDTLKDIAALQPSFGIPGTALPEVDDDEWNLEEDDVSATVVPNNIAAVLNELFDSEEKFNEALKLFDDTDVSIVLTVTAGKKNIITKATLDVSAEVRETKKKAVVNAVLDLSDEAKKTLAVTSEESDGEGSSTKDEFLFTYSISENSKEKYAASVSVKQGDVTVDNLVKIDYNKTTGAYSVSVSIPGLPMDKIEVSGTFKYDSKSMTLTVTSLNIGTPITLDLTVKLTTGTKAPEFPAATTDLFSLDETGAGELINKVIAGIGDLGIIGGDDTDPAFDFDFDNDSDFDFGF